MGRRKKRYGRLTDTPPDIEAVDMNNMTYMYYFNRLKDLAMSMFEWKNLPNEIDPRFVELILFEKGYGLFSVDEVMGAIYTQVALGGRWNMYNIPKIRQALASNGYNRKLTEENSVVVYNDYLHMPSVNIVALFAKRLTNLERTCDINIHAQRTPVLISCTENERLSMKNLYDNYNGYEPVIFGSKELSNKEIKTLNTEAPFVADRILEIKFQIWNECMTYLGISNTNYVKKERMVSDEVARNMGGTIASRYSRLDMRKQACEKCNEMFDWNIDVEYREDMYQQITDAFDDFNQKGGGEDE